MGGRTDSGLLNFDHWLFGELDNNSRTVTWFSLSDSSLFLGSSFMKFLNL